jgi:hypothetical protein
VVEAIESAGGTALASAWMSPMKRLCRPRWPGSQDELGAPTVLVNNAGVTRDLLFRMTTTTGTRS